MDPTDPLFVAAIKADTYWKTDSGRDSAERDRVTDFYAVSEMHDGSENAWVPLRRRERMAEACYDC